MINVATINIDIRKAFLFAFRINVLLTAPLAISDEFDAVSGSEKKNNYLRFESNLKAYFA